MVRDPGTESRPLSRHFADTEALLVALAESGWVAAAPIRVPAATSATGCSHAHCHVDFAVDNGAIMEWIFAGKAHGDTPAPHEAGERAFDATGNAGG